MSAKKAAKGTSRGKTRGKKKGKGPRRSILWRWRRGLFVLILVAVLGLTAAGYALTQIPLPDEEPLLQTSFICASDVVEDCNRNNSLAQLSGGEDRVSVTYDQLPPVLIDAVLAAEDQDFFEHPGLDPVAIGRAAWSDIREQGTTQGGSTITQQYVKNVYLTNERTLTRKIKEAVLAVKLEGELEKQEILLRYLNTIYFGRGAYGVQAASRAYFGKDVADLGLAEAAYLAGLIRSPESGDAWRDTDRTTPAAQEEQAEAERRRRVVLDAMVEQEWITVAERDAADAVPFEEPYLLPRRQASNFGSVQRSEIGTDYFVEYVRQQLRAEGYTDAQIYGGGLRVYTTLDYGMQEAAYTAVTDTLDRPDDPAAALVAIDDQGRVRAMMGGLDWNASKVNLATGTAGGGSGRQPGSSFKPFVLAEAMNQGISVQSLFDSPSQITIPDADNGDDWKVSNYGSAAYGTQNLVEATQKSSNTVYAQLMAEVGSDRVVELANRMGISAELPSVPALVLGTAEVSVLDMASAFSTFANEGEHLEPIVITRIEDQQGNVLESFVPERERVLDEQIAKTTNWVLNQVIEGGTGTGAEFGQEAAGKTGTTQENRDAWFVGYTCELTAAVWMGYTDADADGSPRVMDSVHGQAVTGGSLPATIWRRFMDEATEGLGECPFPTPSRFPGELMNGELATTTTDESDATTTTDTDSTATTTAPSSSSTTSTTSPTTAPPTVPPTTGAPIEGEVEAQPP
jgi:penicillin-binding protein 1A